MSCVGKTGGEGAVFIHAGVKGGIHRRRGEGEREHLERCPHTDNIHERASESERVSSLCLERAQYWRAEQKAKQIKWSSWLHHLKSVTRAWVWIPLIHLRPLSGASSLPVGTTVMESYCRLVFGDGPFRVAAALPAHIPNARNFKKVLFDTIYVP